MNKLAAGLSAALVVVLIAGSVMFSSVGQAPAVDPAQTALTSSVETTLSRRLLMLSIGSNNDMLHEMLDGVLPMDELEFRSRLDSISAALYAFPSLYRTLPNPYTEEGATADAARVSLATPAVWENFETFKALSYDASMKAKEGGEGQAADFLARVEELEVMCENCHETYRQPFEYLDFDNIEGMIK